VTIATTGSAAREPQWEPRRDWPFLIASVLAAALLAALVLIDGQPAAAALLLSGFALGAVFLKARHRRLRRRHRVRLAARLGVVCGGVARLLDRHRLAAAVRPVARVTAMRAVYAVVFLIAFAALLGDHLTSPSSGRPVSPEDFAGACAPCGAPCPSVRKK
jgi:hypothetical protein